MALVFTALSGLVVAAVSSSNSGASCPSNFKIVHGVGYTASSNYFNLSTQTSSEDCCAACSAFPSCNVWTFHPDQQTGSGPCTLGTEPIVNPDAGAQTISGSRVLVPPPPPPPTPRHIQPLGPVKPGSPNIIFFLTDDQDSILGGWDPMSRSNKLLSQTGATGKYWVTHTPVCCPSRTELLASRYFHNIKVADMNAKGCMHAVAFPDWPEDHMFAPHLRAEGYRVGFFGKFLNNGNPALAPAGVESWFVNGGGNYLNPSFSWEPVAGQGPQNGNFNNTSAAGAAYSTSVIGNVSLSWVEASLKLPNPFVAYIAPKAPHIQDGNGFPTTIPAPWYNDTFPGVAAPRTKSWNYSALDHHWMIAQQQPMTTEEAFNSDLLYRHRHQALLSVDDIVASVIAAVEAAGAMKKTYFIYSSDHGYRFGQFRMPQGKWNVYDNNIRIPFVISGPGITKNSTFDFIGSNVDVVPTILGLAGVETPNGMDGRSIAPELMSSDDATLPLQTKLHVQRWAQDSTRQPWRENQLIEYYGLGNVVRYQHLEDTFNNTFRALRVLKRDPTTNQKMSEAWSNVLYAEFTDIQIDFNFTGQPEFYELYDLDADPDMLVNAYKTADQALKDELHTNLPKVFGCQGSPDSATAGSCN